MSLVFLVTSFAIAVSSLMRVSISFMLLRNPSAVCTYDIAFCTFVRAAVMRVGLECHQPVLFQVVHDALHVLAVGA